jgi:hypothetical protein
VLAHRVEHAEIFEFMKAAAGAWKNEQRSAIMAKNL